MTTETMKTAKPSTMWEEMRGDMRAHSQAMRDDPSCPGNFEAWRAARHVQAVVKDLLRRGYQVFVNAAPGEKPEIVFLDGQDELHTVSVGRSLRELGVEAAAEVQS